MKKAVTFPIDVHVFNHSGISYVFDVRNFNIFKLNSKAAAILLSIKDYSIDEIINKFVPDIPIITIKAYYLKFLELIRDEILSVNPLPVPPKPLFHRLVLMLAGGCNMGCKYCFEKDVTIHQNYNLMTKDIANDVLDWFFKYQAGKKAHIQLYGGEPLLNWPVLKFVINKSEKWAKKNNIELSKYLITNGTLLNREKISWIKSHDIIVQVSVDGNDETHDKFRVFKDGTPTLKYIKPNIQRLITQGANFNLRAVLTRENKSPSSIIEGLKSLGAEKVSFEIVSTNNLTAKLTEQDWEEFNESYKHILKRAYSEWNQLLDEMQKIIIRICSYHHLFYGCAAGLSEVTIAPDGAIYECQRLYQKPYCHIKDDKSPAEIQSNFLTMVDERKICKNCWVRYLCGGGCLQQSYLENRNEDPLTYYCEMKRNLVEAAIVKIEEIRRSNKVID